VCAASFECEEDPPELNLVPMAGAEGTVIEYLGANRWRVTGYARSTDRGMGFRDSLDRCINVTTVHSVVNVVFRQFSNCGGGITTAFGGFDAGNYLWGTWTNYLSGGDPVVEFTALA
jgi:hypothetical protein